MPWTAPNFLSGSKPNGAMWWSQNSDVFNKGRVPFKWGGGVSPHFGTHLVLNPKLWDPHMFLNPRLWEPQVFRNPKPWESPTFLGTPMWNLCHGIPKFQPIQTSPFGPHEFLLGDAGGNIGRPVLEWRAAVKAVANTQEPKGFYPQRPLFAPVPPPAPERAGCVFLKGTPFVTFGGETQGKNTISAVP